MRFRLIPGFPTIGPICASLPSRYKAPSDRPKCPFYGFFGHRSGIMADNQGNCCALTLQHYPCSMETEGKKPDWDVCTAWNRGRDPLALKDNVPEYVQEFIATVQVFPNELQPKDGVSSGVMGPEWFRMVMERDP